MDRKPVQSQIVPPERVQRRFNLKNLVDLGLLLFSEVLSHAYCFIRWILLPGQDPSQLKPRAHRGIGAGINGSVGLKVRVKDPVVAGIAKEVDDQVSRGILRVGLLCPSADLVKGAVSEGTGVVHTDGAVVKEAVLHAGAPDALGVERGLNCELCVPIP